MKPVALLFLLLGCSRDPNEGSLSQNAAATFAPCSASEINYMKSRHNFMLAFEPCGKNNFEAYAWSPDGTHLYFQLVMTGYVMDAVSDNRLTVTVPTPTPIGEVAWVSNERLVVPVDGDTEGGGVKLAVWDLPSGDPDAPTAAALRYVRVPDLVGVQAVLPDVGGGVLVVGDARPGLFPEEPHGWSSGGAHRVFRLSLDAPRAQLAEAYAFMGSVDSFSREAGVLVVGRGDRITLYQEGDGLEIAGYDHARRGILHPDGRWLVLEFPGEAVSVFQQRSWNELSDRARAREIARVKQFEARLPDGIQTEVSPPMFSIVDRTTGQRTAFTGFMGTHFSWYQARPSFASFVLWGFEGKQYKRNVLLGNLADRLNAIEKGRTMTGLEPFVAPTHIVGESEEVRSQ